MKYVVIVYAAGFIVNMINPAFYYEWLMLDIDRLLHGQVWRLITFIIQPIEDNILFMLIMLYVYYSIGTTLERVWGTFFFNVYYFMGVFFNIIAVVIIYVIMYFKNGVGFSFPVPLEYLNLSMLLAFALTFPEARFYLMFLIPFKAKYLIFLYLGLMAYTVYNAFSVNFDIGICVLVAILAAMANFVIYFFMTKKHLHPANIKRRMQFQHAARQSMQTGYATNEGGHKVITRHKCAVCGRTELDGENLQFRFCSKCNGNYEYCQDHLFTHTHIQ